MAPWGGQSCVVIGCKKKLYSFEKGIHQFSFPTCPILRDVWIKFSRRGSNFNIKKTNTICEKHFDQSCILGRKKLKLITGSVPTIFYRETQDGIEKIRVQYDSSVMHYSEADMELLKPAYDKDDHENELLDKRKKRLLKIAQLCRFCLDEQNEAKLVELKKLKDYAISAEEVYKLMAIETMREKIWSEFACEECFQQIIAFDGFRKRCSKAQKDTVMEMRELDKIIVRVQHGVVDEENLMKVEMDEPENEFNSEATKKNRAIVIKSGLKSGLNITMKQELQESDVEYNDCDSVDSNDVLDRDSLSPAEGKTSVIENMDEERLKENESIEGSKVVSQAKVINANKVRIYECFFCSLKFGGKKVFKAHRCTVKEKKCQFDGCDKVFYKMSGYNAHIMNIHKMLKVSRMFCSLCNFSMVTNASTFREHRLNCEKRSLKKIANNAIKCKECGKVCINFQSYKIHSMFHISSVTANETKKTGTKENADSICDACGKKFASSRYLRDHKKRVHSTTRSKMFICDFCGKEKRTRSIFMKHMQSVHAKNPSPCKVCGKVFRNKALLQAHMIYHKDSKRIHFCPMCPNKPPYVTAVALRRHQETHHGYGAGYHCEVCYAVYKSRPGLTTHLMSSHGIRKSSTGVIP